MNEKGKKREKKKRKEEKRNVLELPLSVFIVIDPSELFSKEIAKITRRISLFPGVYIFFLGMHFGRMDFYKMHYLFDTIRI